MTSSSHNNNNSKQTLTYTLQGTSPGTFELFPHKNNNNNNNNSQEALTCACAAGKKDLHKPFDAQFVDVLITLNSWA